MRLLPIITLMATIVSGAVAVRGADVIIKQRAAESGRIEFTVDPGATYSNPFDPDEIAIDATFTGPNGESLSLPAFRDEQFFVRFYPTSPGKWSMTAAVRDKSGQRQSQPLSFDVEKTNSRGFIRRAKDNTRYFQYDSGDPYFVIGLNMAWPDRESGAARIGEWFKKLSDNGGNWARVWMCHPPVMIENKTTGLGRYDLPSAKYFDQILDEAQQRGIGVMLCFINHRDLIDKDRWGNAIWPVNPYNAANGGPATRPADFFTDERARAMFKRRLRYIVARYGAYTSVMCWELVNEQEFAQCPVPNAWNAEMARELKRIDPYQHLVSTSSSVPDPVWQDPNMDLTQRHIYGDGSMTDMIGPIAGASAKYDRFAKPHLLAEFGIDYKGSDLSFDPDGKATTLHNSLWAAAMAGSAGGACNWWWDNYIDKLNLWWTYRGISNFAAKIDWPRRHFDPIRLPPPQHGSTVAAEETFSDLTLTSAGGWGKSHGQTIEIAKNGQATVELPKFLYGSRKSDMQTTTRFQIEMPHDGAMVIHIGRVSDYSVLRVSIDGKPQADFAFSALPQSPDNANAKPLEDHPDVWQADVKQDRRVTLGAGRHTVELDNIAGDWVSLDSITFTNARSSRYPAVSVLAMQDKVSGETIGWLCDMASNWKSDQDGIKYATFDDVVLTVPVPESLASKPMSVEWWDTRKGQIIARREGVTATDGALVLNVPSFTRDIAVRLAP